MYPDAYASVTEGKAKAEIPKLDWNSIIASIPATYYEEYPGLHGKPLSCLKYSEKYPTSWYNDTKSHSSTDKSYFFSGVNRVEIFENRGIYLPKTNPNKKVIASQIIKPLLDLVDEGKIALTPAEKLSYLKEEEQRALAELIQDYEATPSLSQAVKLKEMSAMQLLDADMMFEVMSRPKPNQKEMLKLDLEVLRDFFPDYTPKDIESAILRILTEWQKREQSKVQSRNSWDRDGR